MYFPHINDNTRPNVDDQIWTPFFTEKIVEYVGREWPTYIVEKWERNAIGETRFIESRTYDDRTTINKRGKLFAALEYERGVLEERERLRERVEKLRRKEPWPQFVTAGSMEEAARTANNNVVDDVLAILKEDTLVQDDR